LQRSDSEEMLYGLEAENLFIKSLDKTHTWYRFNPLFARFLQNYLATQFSDLVEPLHVRAFQWFQEKGETADAIYHALAGKQMSAAAEILEKTTYQTHQDSNYGQISTWINQLSEKELNQHPFLYVYQAFADSMLGRIPYIELRLTEAENALTRMDTTAITANEREKLIWYIQIIRGINQIKYYNAHEGIVEVKNLVANAPVGTKYVVETANSFLGEALVQMGLMKEAQRAFKQAIAADEEKVNLVGHFYFHIGLARSYKLAGQLKQAEQEDLAAIQVAQKSGLDEALIMLPQFMISMIAMDRAKPALNEVWVNYFRSQPNWFETSPLQWEYIVLIELFLVRLLLSLQNLPAAKLYFAKVNHTFEVHQQPPAYWPVEYIDMQTHIWLAEKDFATAEKELINRIEILKATNNALTREYVSLGRVLYTAGHYEQALPYLTESIEQARLTEQGELLLESLILLSLVYDQLNQKDEAVQQIGKAVMIAEPQGYIRFFTEMGPAMKSLLERYWKNITAHQPVMHSANELFFLKNLMDSPELIGENLKEENGQSIFNLPVRQPEIEPLSSREQEVMQLVLRGMSTKKVAATLHISSNTAKTHIRNIYRKYGVGSIHELIKIIRL
jgi:LuxR family maltose regulon positive regulatory protein